MRYKVHHLNQVKGGWYHKWYSLPDCKLHECVKGPLKFPLLAVPIPYIMEDDEAEEHGRCSCFEVKEHYSKPGIPDPWDEFLLLREESIKGKDVSSDFPKRDIDITTVLNRQYRLYLGQGIPDPWKKWVVIQPEKDQSNIEKLKDTKSCLNTVINPGCVFYDTENVCCPNCNRKLIVLCMKNESHEDNTGKETVGEEVHHGEEKENISQEKKVKDASMETDNVIVEDKGVSIRIPEKCSCNVDKFCSCKRESKCKCPLRGPVEKKAKRSSCRNERNLINNRIHSDFAQNGSYKHYIPLMIRSCGLPQDKCSYYRCIKDGNPQCPCEIRMSATPVILNNFQCTPSEQFVGMQDKCKNHCYRIKLVCEKCERKTRRKGKAKRKDHRTGRKEKYLPCPCDKVKTGQRYNEHDQTDGKVSNSLIVNDMHQMLQHYDKTSPVKSNKFDERKCDISPQSSRHQYKTQMSSVINKLDKDYFRLLEILGMNGHFHYMNAEHRNEYLYKSQSPYVTSGRNMRSITIVPHKMTDLNSPTHYKNVNRERVSEPQWDCLNNDLGASRNNSIEFHKKNNRKQVEPPYAKPFPFTSFHNYENGVEVFRNKSAIRKRKRKRIFKKELNSILSKLNENYVPGGDSSSTSDSSISSVEN